MQKKSQLIAVARVLFPYRNFNRFAKMSKQTKSIRYGVIVKKFERRSFMKVPEYPGSGMSYDSAEKVFFRKSEKNISHTDALYRTIGAWLIIFFIPNFCE